MSGNGKLQDCLSCALTQLAGAGFECSTKEICVAKFVGSKAKIYCMSTCGNARRIVNERREFGSHQDAQAAGYRPGQCCLRDDYKLWKESQGLE